MAIVDIVGSADPTSPPPYAPARSFPPARAKRSRKVWLAIADLAAVIIGLLCSTAIRASIGGARAEDVRHWLTVAAVSLPVWITLAMRLRLYSSRFVSSGLDEIRRVVYLSLGGTSSIAVISAMAEVYASRGWLLLSAFTTLTALTIERRLARRHFDRLRRRGQMLRRVLIVGANREGLALHRMFRQEPSVGYDTVGFIDDLTRGYVVVDGERVPVLGTVDETMTIADATGATGAVIAATAMDLANSNRLIRELTERGIHVELSSTLQDIATDRLTVRRLGRFPVVYIEPVQRFGWRALAKRTFDVSGAVAGLMVLAPIALVAAAAVKLSSRGPVLFRQTRVGHNGQRFDLWKFRTMVSNAEDLLDSIQHLNISNGPLFKAKDDPRITRVGRLLRRTSIDEIPQLWNVVCGHMSLVGPRPALPRELEGWSDELHQRLRVRPGITGMWQVHGRGNEDFELYERLDLYYVDNWSLITDLAIIAQTVPAVLGRRGAM